MSQIEYQKVELEDLANLPHGKQVEVTGIARAFKIEDLAGMQQEAYMGLLQSTANDQNYFVDVFSILGREDSPSDVLNMLRASSESNISVTMKGQYNHSIEGRDGIVSVVEITLGNLEYRLKNSVRGYQHDN